MPNSPFIYGPQGATSLVPGGVTLPDAAGDTIQIQPSASTTSHVLTMPPANAVGALTNNGSGTLSWSPSGGSAIMPTVTRITASGTTNYVPPSSPSPLYLMVEMIGGGGGGGGGGQSGSGNGTPGDPTTINSTLLMANGGDGGVSNGGTSVASGGTVSFTAGPTILIALRGSAGGGSSSSGATVVTITGGPGGPGPWGGAGAGNFNTVGSDATFNSGAGGGGGGYSTIANNAFSGAGGASGGYIKALLPTGSYTCVVGAGGGFGSGGMNGFPGGSGGSGQIIITEYYQ